MAGLLLFVVLVLSLKIFSNIFHRPQEEPPPLGWGVVSCAAVAAAAV